MLECWNNGSAVVNPPQGGIRTSFHHSIRSTDGNGFTLLELIVVMFLVALASSLVYINVGRTGGASEEKTFAREMLSLCRKARLQAVVRGEPAALYISSHPRRVWISGGETSIEIPRDMLIEGDGVAPVDENVFAVRFFPDGSSSGGELYLSAGGRRIYSLQVDLLTGLIHITQGA